MAITMTRKQAAGAKLVINARVDKDDVQKLDRLAEIPGTVNFNRSRSELIGFAIHEYIERHARASSSRVPVNR